MTDTTSRLSAALADRYVIQRELGAGGMATVYLARDVKHDRDVAVKVLRPELAAVIGVQRFLNEITVTANLQHPNILPLHDSGEADGFLFYVMPYVEGETLADRVRREKQLAIEDAVAIAATVAGALAYAHHRGVLHRDIKPANIMLTGGQAVVADFGIALALSAAGGERVTETGLSLGTPEYMSPEQATGDRDPDARSDIYSLGSVLYEMLTGSPPHTGGTVQALVAKLLAEKPSRPRLLRDTIPDALDRAVMKALAKTPADRYSSAEEFGQAIKDALRAGKGTRPALPVPWLGGAFGIVAALIAVLLFWPRGGGDSNGSVPPVAEVDRRSVAVLPFENIGGDPEAEYFSDGVTEDIIATISKVGDLTVISRTSVMQYKGTTKSLRDIGSELGVATVLEGSVRRAGDRVRVVAQLIDVGTEESLWADTYDRELSDIFAIQTDVAQNIARALGSVLGPSAAPTDAPTSDLDAYQLYLRARALWNQRTGSSVRSAIDLYQQAIDRDPRFGLAYAGLAEAWVLMPVYAAWPAQDAADMAHRAVDSALAIDSTLSGARAALGWIAVFTDWDFERGIADLRQAIRLNPGNATARQWLGIASAWNGDHDEAVTQMERALELDPASRIINSDLAYVLFIGRRYEESERQWQRTLELDSRFGAANWRLAWLYGVTGRDSLAAEMLERWNSLDEVPLFEPGTLRAAYREGGSDGLYRRLLELPRDRLLHSDVAFWFAKLGRVDDAVTELERDADARGTFVGTWHESPRFDSLRQDPRFQALLERVFGTD